MPIEVRMDRADRDHTSCLQHRSLQLHRYLNKGTRAVKMMSEVLQMCMYSANEPTNKCSITNSPTMYAREVVAAVSTLTSKRTTALSTMPKFLNMTK
jgi:hypothetical protein